MESYAGVNIFLKNTDTLEWEHKAEESLGLLFITVSFLVVENGFIQHSDFPTKGSWSQVDSIAAAVGTRLWLCKEENLSTIRSRFFESLHFLISHGKIEGIIGPCHSDGTSEFLQIQCGYNLSDRLETACKRVYLQGVLSLFNLEFVAEVSNTPKGVLDHSEHPPNDFHVPRKPDAQRVLRNPNPLSTNNSVASAGSGGWLWTNTASPHHSCKTSSVRFNPETGHPELTEDRMNCESMENLSWATTILSTDQTKILQQFVESLNQLAGGHRDKVSHWESIISTTVESLRKRAHEHYKLHGDSSYRDFNHPLSLSIFRGASQSQQQTDWSAKQAAAKLVLDNATKLFYMILPAVIENVSTQITDKTAIVGLLCRGSFLSGLLSVCFDAMAYAYSLSTHNVKQLEEIFDVDLFEVWKVIEPVLHVQVSIPTTVRRHLSWLEEQLLERYILQKNPLKITASLEKHATSRRVSELCNASSIRNELLRLCTCLPASVGLFLKKVARMGASRIEFLIESFNIVSRISDDHPNAGLVKQINVASVAWTVYMYCISNTNVFCEFFGNPEIPRTIDQLVLCSVYATFKMLGFRIEFADVVQAYAQFCGNSEYAASTVFNLSMKKPFQNSRDSKGGKIISLYNEEFLPLTRNFLQILKAKIFDAGGGKSRISTLIIRLPRTRLNNVPVELGGSASSVRGLSGGPGNLVVSLDNFDENDSSQKYYNVVDLHSSPGSPPAENDPNFGLLALCSAADIELRTKPGNKRLREDFRGECEQRKSVRDSPVSVHNEEGQENISPNHFETPGPPRKKSNVIYSFGDNPVANSCGLRKINSVINQAI